MSNKNICVVFLCNKEYLNRFIKTLYYLRHNGNYNGNICLIIGDDLYNSNLLDELNDFIVYYNITIKYFPDIKFSDNFYTINNKINSDGRNITKKFQWHKFHLFNTFFKQWNYIFYIDCGITIFSDISPIINEVSDNILLAHSDAFPEYKSKLYNQFDSNNKVIFQKLNQSYNLNIDYFQTTILLYDTNIIQNNTFENLVKLAETYPISLTNEQGIIALYFTNIYPVFKQIKIKNNFTYFYDFLSRNPSNKYIMLKSYSI